MPSGTEQCTRRGRLADAAREFGLRQRHRRAVAGFLEQGEHPEAAVLREVHEELGLAAKLEGMIGIYPFERLNQIIFAYHVVVGPGEIRLDATELDAYREVPFAKLKPWRQGTGPALHAWLKARGYDLPLYDFGTPLDD